MRNFGLLFLLGLLISCFFVEKEEVTEKIILKEYSVVLKSIKIERQSFQSKYKSANSIQKEVILKKAKKYLFKTLSKDIFPQWYGTAWDFNGTTRTPKKGKIACGYFVTNTLTDVGFNIPRIKWAQSASEVFIKKLAPTKDIVRFSNKPLAKVIAYFKKKGDGLYLVGLDSHTGFVVVNKDKINFVHANYYQREIGVMSEDISTKNPFGDSKYRVIGKLLSDKMVENWILNKRY